MSKPPDNLTPSPMGIQAPPGTPVLQYRTGGFTVAGDPPVYVPPADPAWHPLPAPVAAWHPVPADPWAPNAPTPYQESQVAGDRSAVYQPAADVRCLRCGRAFTGYRPAVLVAPPGLPRVAVCLLCLEAGDQVQPRPEAP